MPERLAFRTSGFSIVIRRHEPLRRCPDVAVIHERPRHVRFLIIRAMAPWAKEEVCDVLGLGSS